MQTSSLVHSRVWSSNKPPHASCLCAWVTETTGSVQRSALLRPLVAGSASCRRQEGAAPPLTTGGQPRPASSMVEQTGVTQQRTPKMGPLPDLYMTGTGAGDADGPTERQPRAMPQATGKTPGYLATSSDCQEHSRPGPRQMVGTMSFSFL